MPPLTQYHYNGATISIKTIEALTGKNRNNLTKLISKAKLRGQYIDGGLSIDEELSDYLISIKLNYDEYANNLLIARSIMPEADFSDMTTIDIFRNITEHYGLSDKVYHDSGSYEYALKIFKYLIGTELEPLIAKNQRLGITYNGATYERPSKFYSSLKIIKKTLMDTIINLGGDYQKAILMCEDDPEFGAVLEPVIRGVKYTSVRHACLNLGISPAKYKKLYREYKDYDVAYDKYLEGIDVDRVETKFPFEYNGRRFLNINELSTFLGTSDSNMRRLLVLYDKDLLSIIHYALGKEEKYIIPHTNISYVSLDDLGDNLGMTRQGIRAFKYKDMTGVDAFLTYVYDARVPTKGRLIITNIDFMEFYKIPNSCCHALRNFALKHNLADRGAKLELIAEKIRSILSLVDSDSFNGGLTEIIGYLNIDYTNAIKLLLSDITSEQFMYINECRGYSFNSSIDFLLENEEFVRFLIGGGYRGIKSYADDLGLSIPYITRKLSREGGTKSISQLDKEMREFGFTKLGSSSSLKISTNIFE